MSADSSKSKSDNEIASSVDQDELQLVGACRHMWRQKLGYKQTLHRTWGQVESFAVGFCSLNFIGTLRSAFFLGIAAGGPAALWSSYLIALVFMWITAAVLAEICSALPLSGSLYIWAAKSASPKYARLVGFIVAWWACTAWMTFCAFNSQTSANYLASILAIYGVEFPGGIDIHNVKWRAIIWIFSETFLILASAMAYLPPRWYSRIFRITIGLMILDFFLCVIWLPIGASKTYGFRSAKDVFTSTFNGTGAPPAWNWILSLFVGAGTLTGFDASGHIAEETKNARVVAPRGIFSSAIATGVLGFTSTILFLFCTPDLQALFAALKTPQPFVAIYAVALGRGGMVFMSILAIITHILSTSIAIVASSRLVFAVARDGVLPGSKWIGVVTNDGQPRNAVTVVFVFAATLLCMILPSELAFSSLVSAAAVPIIAANALIALLRLTMTPNSFKSTHFRLGIFRKPFYLAAALFNGLILAIMFSPVVFPVSADTFNFACAIFGAVTLFALISWWFIPEGKWLRKDQLHHMDERIDDDRLI